MSVSAYVGIDPGLSGCLAVITPAFPAGGELVDIPIVDKKIDCYGLYDAINEILSTYNVMRICLEKAQPFPKQGVVSVFSYGELYGMIKAILEVERAEYDLIPPQRWKRMLSHLPKGKDSSIAFVRSHYPHFNLKRGKGKKDDHNRADAICLAHYALTK